MSDYWKEVSAPAKTAAANPELEILRPSNDVLLKKAHNGAGWALTVAALSALNLMLGFFNTPVRFFLGLQVTDVIYEIGRAVGPLMGHVALVFSLAVLALLGLLVYQARKLQMWAFYILIGALVVDFAIFCLMQYLASRADAEAVAGGEGFSVGSMIVGVLVHVLCLIALISGAHAAKTLERRKLAGITAEL